MFEYIDAILLLAIALAILIKTRNDKPSFKGIGYGFIILLCVSFSAKLALKQMSIDLNAELEHEIEICKSNGYSQIVYAHLSYREAIGETIPFFYDGWCVEHEEGKDWVDVMELIKKQGDED